MEHTDQQILQLLVNPKYAKKSTKQLTDLIWLIFGNPQSLSTKFQIPVRNISSLSKSHNIDIETLSKLYKSIDAYGKNSDISACLDKSFTRFEQEVQLKNFLKNNDRLRYFFIVLLWQKLLNDPIQRKLLMRFLAIIANLGNYRKVLSEWIDDLPTQPIAFIVQNLQRQLQTEIEKLLPETIDQNNIKEIDSNIKNICTFLQILDESNKRRKRIPQQAFINNKVSQYFQPISQFKLHLKNITNLNFLFYPFLLPLDYKYRLLQIQSIFQQKLNVQKSMESGLANLLSGMVQLDQNGNISIEGLVFLHFQINRTNILDDSMEKLGKTTQNLKSPMRIQFIGEEGADEGGVKNQYFQLLTKEIFNPYLDMFIPKNHGRVYWFNAYSYQAPIRFQFVGMLLGLSIYNGVHLDIHFPQVLYRKLLEKGNKEQQLNEQIINDLSTLDPQLASSLKKILDSKQPLQDLQLYFNIEFQHFGEKIIQELVQDGNNIQLNQDNKAYYVHLYADYILNKHTHKQFTAFKRGFLRVVSGAMINLFNSDQLEHIICGSQNIDFKQLQSTTNYEGGFTKDSPIIKYLWEILHSFNLEEKKQFLVFVTGSDRVPIDGLKALNMIVQKHSANFEHLPTAHTCFNVFLLPQYPTKQKLQEKLRLILKNNQGFGLI